MFYNSRGKCELCDKEHKDNCDFGLINENATIGRVFNQLEGRKLVLVVQWRNHPQANIQLIEKPMVVE